MAAVYRFRGVCPPSRHGRAVERRGIKSRHRANSRLFSKCSENFSSSSHNKFFRNNFFRSQSEIDILKEQNPRGASAMQTYDAIKPALVSLATNCLGAYSSPALDAMILRQQLQQRMSALCANKRREQTILSSLFHIKSFARIDPSQPFEF
jgi:hypothetical protein